MGSSQRYNLIGWLDGPEAERRAARELQLRRLPSHLVDDVLQEARVKAWMRIDDPRPIENPAAYGMRVISNAVLDLHRHDARRAQLVEIDRDFEDDAVADLPPNLVEDGLRRAAAGSISGRPWTAAAALTHITFALHEIAVPHDAPSPDGLDRQRDWAALWLSGERSCFPAGSTPEDAAMRMRRSRALGTIREHLGRVVRAALQESPR